MKLFTLLLTLSLTVSLSFAAVSDDAFQRAYAHYKKGDFQNAYNAFNELFFVGMDDERVNFYLGRSALELKEYDAAVAAFERVLILKPNHARSRLELGRAYFGLGMFDQAEAEFNQVLQIPIPPEVRESVERYLALIIQGQKKNYLSGMVAFGIQSTSNVNNGNDYKILALSSEELNPEASDTSHAETLTLRHIYDFFGKGGFFWQTDGLVYAQSYSEYDDLNLIYSSLATGPGVKFDSFAMNLVAGLDRLVFGGEDYIDVSHFSLKMQFPSKDQLLSMSLKSLERKNLLDINTDRDSQGFELAIGMQQSFTSTSTVFDIGFLANTERKKTGDRVDIDFDEAGLRAGLFQQFGASVFVNLSAVVKVKQYVDEFSEVVSLGQIDKVERTDTNQNISATLSYKFLKDYTAALNASQVSNASTYELYNYNKNTVGLTVSMQF